jgi:outer membrane biosynthesis protein TonB
MRSTLSLLAALCAGTLQVGAHAGESYDSARKICKNYPKVLGSVPFPGEAVAANVRAGQVVVEFQPRWRGSPTSIKIISASNQVFVEPTLKAVRKLECKPGKNARARATVEFNNGGE